MTINDSFDELRRACEALDVKSRLKLLQRLDRILITEDREGIRFGCRSRTEYKRIQKRKPWDEPIAEWIRSFTSADVFFDIGANIGSFSLLAGKLHAGRVRVFSFEPGFDTFAALARNILLNNLQEAITPLQIALFDETGLRPFHYHKLGAGSALHAVGEPIDYARRRFEPVAVQSVPAFRLDDLVEQLALPLPTRVKLDVDGAEPRVLAGAARTLGSGRSELWAELTEVEPGDAAPLRTIRLLNDLGFELQRRVDHDAASGTYPQVYDAFFTRR